MLTKRCNYSNLFKPVVLAAGLAVCIFSYAKAEINWDELEEKAKRYTGESNNGSTGRAGQTGGKQLNLSIPSQPTGRSIDTSSGELSTSDKNYILVHMKNANRNFAKKRYDLALREIELVFTKQPDHPGARFMRAVIAGRLKDHPAAWHNILIAREKDPQNPKIKTFIDKLKTVAPEPEKMAGVPGIFRPLPVSASEKACDIIERFLQLPASQNVIKLSITEMNKNQGSVWLGMELEASAPMNRDEVSKILQTAAGGRVETAAAETSENADKKLKLKIEIPDLEIENKNVKPASDLRDFIKSVSEDIDVAISDTMERDAENKILDTTYEIAVRDFKTLNDFLRSVSPYAHKYQILSMKLAYITGSQNIIWKCQVQVFYQQ